MIAFLKAGEPALSQARESLNNTSAQIPVDGIKIEAPILQPSKILSVGLNYVDHAEECEVIMSEVPIVFNKQVSSVNSPYGDIYLPRESEQLDYECELGVVIGKTCRRVPKEKAESVIAGYTVLNDVTVRDWQLRISQWTIGKSWDTHCPFGPAIVTKDEVSDPHNLDMCLWVNDEVRQKLNTRDMYFNIFDIVEYLSTVCTLEPGDLITTGTGGGVGLFMEPQTWLKVGDTVRVAISELGEICNTVINEPESTVRY